MSLYPPYYAALSLLGGVSATTVPGAPTNVVAYAGNASGSLFVTWNASAGTPSLYTVTAVGGGNTFKTTTTGTSASISGLTNGTSYTVSVSATNSAGVSNATTYANTVSPISPPAVLVGQNALLCWLDANQLTGQSNGVALTGGNWPDFSGNGNNFVAGSGQSVPSSSTAGTYNSSWTNSKPAVTFSAAGNGNAFNCPSLTGAYIGGEQSMFIALATDNSNPQSSGVQCIWSNALQNGDAGNGITVDITVPSGNFRTYDYDAVTLPLIAEATTPGVLSIISPWNKGLYRNGSQTATAGMTAGQGSASTLGGCIGAKLGQTNYFFSGNFAELLIYRGLVSIADHNTILSYLGTKYNITMTTVTQ